MVSYRGITSRTKPNGLERILKYSAKHLFIKAVYNAAIGFPISMIINSVLINWIGYVATHYVWLYAALIIGIPYFIASFSRQFLIDLTYEKTGILIEPKHLLSVLHKRLVNRNG